MNILSHFGFDGICRPLTWLVHGDFLVGVDVDTKADLVTIKVVDRIEMAKERITNKEKVLILSWQAALVNDEEAFTLIRLVQVLLGVNLKDEVAHLEANRLDLFGNLLTRLLNMAESLITVAV